MKLFLSIFQVIIYIVLFFQCSYIHPNKEAYSMDNKEQYFLDFNFFELKGTKKVSKKPNYYPYVTFIQNNDSIKIYVNVSKNQVFSYNLEKIQDKVWYRAQKRKELGGEFEFKNMIFYQVDKQLIIEYDFVKEVGEKIFYLSKLSIKKPWNTQTYIFNNKKIDIKPTLYVSNETLNQSNILIEVKYSLNKGIFSYYEKKINRQTQNILYENKSCSDIGSSSYFWWVHIGYTFPKVKC